MNEQLSLFELSESEMITQRVEKIEKSSNAVRRGIFARHDELVKLYLKQQREIEELKALVQGNRKNDIEYSFSLAI